MAAGKPLTKPLKLAPRAIVDIEPDGIRIERPSLDDDPNGETILRGRISVDSLSRLRYAAYQREFLPNATNRNIRRAVENGVQLPDITLGMRGDRFAVDSNGVLHLLDPVYVIDGKQRVGTILEHLARYPADQVRLGAVVYFNTKQETEQARFHALGAHQTRISTNIIARNLRDTVPVVATIYGLTATQRDFPLFGRVCWDQQMKKGHLITAVAYIQVALMLHGHLAPTRGAINANDIQAICANLARIVDLQRIRENVVTFWEAVESAWGLRDLEVKAGVSYVKHAFLRVLVRVLSDHTNFWDGDRLVITPEVRKKLRQFKTHDPAVQVLAGSGGRHSMDNLRHVIIDHLNHRQKNKLIPRAVAPAPVVKKAA